MRIAKMQVTPIRPDRWGDDLDVVNAARVSFDKESNWEYGEGSDTDTVVKTLSEKDIKLINYLAKHEHYSPFNHSFLSFRIKAPIFVARQMVKHKFMPWNEVSRRYVDFEPEFYFPEEWRGKPVNAKQGSDGVVELDVRRSSPRNIVEGALNQYDSLLEQGVAPEQARIILPQNMMTEWIWSGTLGAFCDMLRLRLKPNTQVETRELATLIYNEAVKVFPVSIQARIGE